MKIDLLDCKTGTVDKTCSKIINKIDKYVENFVVTCNEVAQKYSIPVVNKRIAVTPISHVGAGFNVDDFVKKSSR